MKKVEKSLTSGFTEKTVTFDKNVQENLKKLSDRLVNIQNNFKTESVSGVDESFDLKFDISNGINKMGLIGVGLGTALAMWWNPVGWAALSLTAVGLIFSFAKAIWSFFDSDFKKSEQKKSVDKNLSNIVNELEKVAKVNLGEVEEKIQPTLLDLKKTLNQPSEQVSYLINDIEQSIHLFSHLSENITISYGVN